MYPEILFVGDDKHLERFKKLLPHSIPHSAKDCVIVFEIKRMACPHELITLLDSLHHKRLMLVAVTGLHKSKIFLRRLEAQILPFLPADTEYLGLHLFPGRMDIGDLHFMLSLAEKTGQAEKHSLLCRAYADSFTSPAPGDVLQLENMIQSVFSAQ